MISMPPPAFPAIPADASPRISSRLRNRIKTGRSSSLWVALSCGIACLLFAIPGLAQHLLLTRHVRPAVLNGQAQPVGHIPAAQIMQLDIVLPLSDQAGLDSLLSELYDPASPSYRHFLTVQEFTARFGPSQANYDAVVAFAKANDLTVFGGTRDGMDVQVKGSVSDVETAFHINMRTYRHPTEDRTFYAPDREPVANLPFQLWHISGLDNYSIPHSRLVKRSDYAQAHGIAPEAVVSYATTGSGPSASFLGSDMRAAYYGGTALNGAGQNLGLWEYEGTDLADLATYFTNTGQTNNVPITLLSTDGTSTSCMAYEDCDDTEQTLDMTQAIGMAPGLSSLVMYVGSSDTAIISAMTTHSPLPTTIGCSWGWTPVDPSTLDPYFQRMAAQGQNFFAASGDSSTWSSSNEAWPSDDANVVSVGGTDLITASAGGSWSSETAWVDGGGGISPDSIPIPAWQQLAGVITSSNRGSATLRNGPDVSANANFTFYTCANQEGCLANEYGGTSFAAPMWAGYTALVNQQLAINGEPTIGFLDPTIYAQNVTSAYNADFHDITVGTSGSYSAVTGYDLVTGWGSPNGQNLISALVGPPVSGFTLSASPSSLSISTGGTGTTTITVNDLAGFTGSVNLSLSGLPSGVTASFSPNSTTGTSVLTFTASNLAATTVSTVTVTGISGAQTESAFLSLAVANSVQITAPSPTNFGAVNIGSTSPAIPMVFTFATPGTIGGEAVLTQGATGLDFADTGTGTCMANTEYSAGQSCVVNVTFTPTRPGTRYGAVVLEDNSGNALVTGHISGMGVGSQINFLPGGQSTVGSGFKYPSATAEDGRGNVYVTDQGHDAVYELLAVNGTVPASPTILTLGSGFDLPADVTVDGGGNVFVADNGSNSVKEILAVNGSVPPSPIIRTLASGRSFLSGVAVDGSGNIYFTDSAVNEILAVNGSIPSSPTIRALGSGFSSPGGVAVDQNGNVYVADTLNNAVKELLAVNGSIPVSPTIETLGSGFNEPDGITLDANGDVYVTNLGNNEVYELLAVNGSIPASPTIKTLGTGFNFPMGLTVDSIGNVYVADDGNGRVVKLDFAAPPSLSFVSTVVGSTSSDSPQTVTVQNTGNAALDFSEISYPPSFPEGSHAATECAVTTSLPTNGSCTLTIDFTPLAGGQLHNSLALTDNALNGAPSTQSITLNGTGQSPPSFTLGATPASLTVIQGASGSSTIAISGQNGFTGSVTLAASGLPSGVTAAFAANPATGSSVLSLMTSSSATVGTATVTVTGTSGTLTASTTVVLTVNPPPSFSLNASPASLSIVQGGSVTSGIILTDLYGFAGSVNLAVTSVLPSGVTASFTPNPTTGTSVLILTASSTAALGPATVTITGTSQTLTASTNLALTINSVPGFAPSSENFGAVNIGSASPVQTLTYTFGSAVTLGSTAVLTQGATGLDFTDAGSDTCTANTAYTAGQTCTFNVTFTPRLAGIRYGAVVINDPNGNVLATGYLQGSGVGPQLSFSPGTQTTLGSGFNYASGVAVDGGGDIFVADTFNSEVKEIVAVNGVIPASPTIRTLGSSFNSPFGVALDAGGNVYVGDSGNNVVKEIMAVNGSIPASPVIRTLGTGFSGPEGVAVDGSGNVYVADTGNSAIKEIVAVSGSIPASPTINIVGNGFLEPRAVAVDSNGNVYACETPNSVQEILAVDGNMPSSPTIITIASGFTNLSGVAVDSRGNLYLTDWYQSELLEIPAVNGSIPTSPNVLTIATGISLPYGVAVDSSGNVYVPNWGNSELVKLDFADAPSLTFASTAVGATSPDSPQTVTVENVGNAALSFPVPVTGSNPSTAANFTLSSSGSSACPLLNAGSSTAGTLAAGASCQLPISFTPTAAGALSGSLVLTDNNLNTAAPGYAVQNISLSGTGTQATPTITWTTPAAITYGTPLSATQLNATASVAGTFTYSPAAGAVLSAGVQTLTATFTPTDTTDYTTATATVTLTVNQATPAITWATPAAITYGTPLSATQLNASSSVAGTFTYSSAAGTVLNAGTQTLTATLTPTDTIDYTTATASVTLTVNKAPLTIHWVTPTAIPYGTALSGTQLDATSTATGTYVYSPAAGTVLAVGSHTLNVTFTPANAANYTSSTAKASVTLTVNKATPAITWATPAAITYGTALSATQLNASSAVAGNFAYSPAAGKVLAAGQQTLTATFTPTNSTDYTTATATVTLTVNKARPTITWATPAAITYGTTLSATQLNAKASVPGAFAYSPAAGTVPAVGTDTLTVTFTPTDTTDYTTATGSVQLKVNPAPSFTLGASPASLTVAQGASGKSTITVTGQNGFTGSVTLAASGLPSGVTAVFATNPTTGSSVLTLTAGSTAAVGSGTVTIKGTSGSLTASTTVAVTISCTPTTIVPYISINGGSTWTEESTATLTSTSTAVDLGPQPASGGSWSWTGPNKYTSTSRQINNIPLTVGADSYLATYTNASGCKSSETFTITVK